MKRIDIIPRLTPPSWARTGHLQTILAHLLPSPTVQLFGVKHVVTLEDGDRIVTYYHSGTSQTLVILFHGLGGSIQSDYMRRTYLLCKQLEHHCVVVNHRGVDDSEGLARNPYHSGRGEDASDVIAYYRKLFPQFKILAIGFSLSGSIVLNLVTGRRGQHLPDAAITVNAPLDLDNCSKKLRIGFNRLYDLRFVHRLSSDLKRKYESGIIGTKYRIPNFATLFDLDQIYTAHAGGFASRDEYYQLCSVKHHLEAVRVPTTILTAGDDPFIDVNDYLEAKYSAMVRLHIEPTGGHVGYLSGSGGMRWLDLFLKTAMKDQFHF